MSYEDAILWVSAHQLELGVAIITGVLGNWLTSLVKFAWAWFAEGLNAAIDRRQRRYLKMLFTSAHDQHVYLSYLTIMFVGFVQANFLLAFSIFKSLGFVTIFVVIYYFQTLFAIQELYRDVIRLRSKWRRRGRIQ